MNRKNILIGILISLIYLSACKKDFFDKKPNLKLLTLSTISEYQQLLENVNVIGLTSALPQLASDEYSFTSYANWQSAASATERNSYLWAKDIFGGETQRQDWNAPYKAIFYANSVLDGLSSIPVNNANRTAWNDLKGWALFVRALEYFDLVSNFSPIYDPSTAEIDLGVPLKLNSGITEVVKRGTVKSTYNQILADLNQASALLTPVFQVNSRNKPSKVSSMALLARIYTYMRDYERAELYADSSLQIYSKLINYNTIDTLNTTPFSYVSDEIIYPSAMITDYSSIAYQLPTTVTIDPNLIKLYSSDDLRRTIFFIKNGTSVVAKRGYVGGGFQVFSGIATDEIYLIKAECAARRNDVTTSMTYLNSLLSKRYKTGKFNPIVVNNALEALNNVLLERRKELFWRGLRWYDVKRLNKEGANITLSRTLNNQTYYLPPNDPKFVFPIPNDEISLSGITQNIR